MQKARSHGTQPLLPLVGVQFQDLFHPLIQGTFHLSLTVLVHYRSLRSIQPYRMVPADSTGVSPAPAYSGFCIIKFYYLYGAITLYGRLFHVFLILLFYRIAALQPHNGLNRCGLGSSVFARHYLRNHYCFLFLRVLRCFSSPGQLFRHQSSTSGVVPFGNLRVGTYLQLTVAYRSLSRPSSPLRAQASTIRP